MQLTDWLHVEVALLLIGFSKISLTKFCFDHSSVIESTLRLRPWRAEGRDDFDACNIHSKGHWKGWALKIETFLGPEMAMCEVSAIWDPKS